MPPSVRRPRLRISSIASYVALTLIAVVTIFPLYWAITASLRPPTQSFKLPPAWIPLDPTIEAYQQVFDKVAFGDFALNSAIVTALIAAGQMLSAGLAGYAFGRLKFPGRTIMFGIVLATMMIPLQATIVPVFMLMRGMGLNDTLLALVLPAWPTAFGTFLMRQYFMGMPNELGEAAEIDGANHWQVFRRIYAPLSRPGLAIVGVLAFSYHWNEFFRPLILTTSEQNFTLPLGLVSLLGNLGTGSVSVVLAGVVLSMIPALVVFIVGQKPLREGLTTAGVNR